MATSPEERKARVLRAEYVRDVAHHRLEMEKGIAAIAAIDALYPLKAADRALAEAVGNQPPSSLTRLVEQIVKAQKGEQVRRLEVQKKLVSDHGYADTDGFKVTLFKTLQRLKKQGLIAGEKQDGTWYYWAS